MGRSPASQPFAGR